MPDFSIVNYKSFMRCMRVSSTFISDEEDLEIMNGTAAEIKESIKERPAVDCMKDNYSEFSGKIKFTGGGGLWVSSKNSGVALDFDFHTVNVGFAGIEIECNKKMTVDIVFVNKLTPNGDINPINTYSRSVARFKVQPGKHMLEMFEPFDFRYLRIIVRDAEEFILRKYT